MVSVGLQVQGLGQLLTALGKVSPEARKQLRTAGRDIGRDLASATAAKVPKRTGRAAASLKASVSGDRVLVTGGGAKAQYYAWLDFGGTVGRGRRSTTTITLYTDRTGRVRLRRGATTRVGKTGTAVRPFIKGGRYLYPTYKLKRAWMRNRLEQAVMDACGSAGLAVKR